MILEEIKKLFEICKQELISIGIDCEKDCKIDINISKRNNKRYGCCIPEIPDKSTKYYIYIKRKRFIKFVRYKRYHIEISPWVMDLDDEIIKNTIIHELIHCLPECDNHGKEFKKYADLVNTNLGYNISRLGNKAKDYEKSNKQFVEQNVYNYKIECKRCGQTFYRKRLNKGFEKKYLCGKCKGKFIITHSIFYLS